MSWFNFLINVWKQFIHLIRFDCIICAAFATLFSIFLAIKSLNLNHGLRMNKISGQAGRKSRKKRETKTEAESEKMRIKQPHKGKERHGTSSFLRREK